METMKFIPEMQGRFGTFTMGYDKANQARAEMNTLMNVVATVMGEPKDTLSVKTVEAFQREVMNAMARVAHATNLPGSGDLLLAIQTYLDQHPVRQQAVIDVLAAALVYREVPASADATGHP